jgi:hypothetical protein
MTTGRRIAVRVGAALIAAAALLIVMPLGAARADCSFNDFLNALENAGSAITSSACDAAYASGVGTTVVVGVGGALAGVAADDPSALNQICQQIQNLTSNLGNAQNDVGTIQNILNQYPAAAGALQTVQDALGGVADPLSAAACACDWVQGVGQLGGAALSCLQDAICGLQQDLGWGGCGCTPPTPVQANCTPPIELCTGYSGNPSDPQCQNAIYGQNGVNPPPTVVQQTANGTIVIDVTDGWDGSSKYCSPDRYCFCPSPMVVVAVDNLIADGGNAANGYVMYVCECPNASNSKLGAGQTTHAAGSSGALAEVCICDSTGLPAVAPTKSTTNPTGSICPIPLTGIPCPQGEIRVGSKCVAPCTSTSEVMTPDGTCCDPNAVTPCGQCCPAGTVANLSNGTCTPPQVIQ